MEQDQAENSDAYNETIENGKVYFTRREEQILDYIITFFVGLVFLTIGILGKPMLSSIIISLLIISYALLISFTDESYSKYIVVALTATHVGSIITYYSNPIIMPFIIIERHSENYSLNIDIVQIIVIYELWRIKPWRRENSKTPNKTRNEREKEEAAVV